MSGSALSLQFDRSDPTVENYCIEIAPKPGADVINKFQISILTMLK